MSPRIAPFSILFAAAAALALPAAASAGTDTGAQAGERYSKEVRYGDLDLTSAQGQKELRQRIVRASYAVCRSGDRLDMALCRQRARDDTKPAVQIALSKARTYAARGAPVVGN